MFNLYDLTEAYKQVFEMLLEEENDEALRDTLEAIEESLDVKIINYVKMIKGIEGPIENLSSEISRLQKKKKNLENKKDFFKNAIKQSMQNSGKTKIKDDLFVVTLQNNPPKLKLKNYECIPKSYIKETSVIYDNAKIKEDLKNGLNVEWAELEKGQSVRIR